MNPKEKAKELIDNFIGLTQQWEPEGGVWEDRPDLAKSCAIIAVDLAILYHPFPNDPDERDKKFHNYWQQVKTEIKKL